MMNLVILAPFNTCDSSIFLMLYSVFTNCALSTLVYQDSQDNQNNEDREDSTALKILKTVKYTYKTTKHTKSQMTYHRKIKK